LLFGKPIYILKTLENGIFLGEVMIGNLGSKAGRSKLVNMVYASEEERSIFTQILHKGCKVYLRMMPKDPELSYEEVVKNN
jgi:mannose/fructose/N-acetylgalactosamine-specific phosphotransferase system component IIB